MRNADRISEQELGVPTLRILSRQLSGYMPTSDLIIELTNLFRPTGKDAELIPGRHDTHFSQKVRNLISHKEAPGNIIAEGYADHVGEGLKITDVGRVHLENLGS